MQIENATLRIRERSYVELLDLAVLVTRRYAVPFLACLAIGVLPIAAFNVWAEVPRLIWWSQAWIYAIEIPVATAPWVLYLGQAAFVARPSYRKVLRDLLGSMVQIALLQVAIRAILVPLILPLPYIFGRNAFLAEIILLERGSPAATSRRSNALHQGATLRLLAHWLASLLHGAFLGGALWYALASIRESLLGRFRPPPIPLEPLATPEAQIALWLTAGFLATVHFLSYLDLRIRREGWELELILRAQARRLEPAPVDRSPAYR